MDRHDADARGEATQRLFLAVFPSPEAREAAALAAEALHFPGDGVSWVKRENLHYTLRFLGEFGADGAKRAAEAARETASRHAPFAARLGRFGAFPSAARARVLWLGMDEGADQLRAVAHALAQSLEGRGFWGDDKKFAPHLTVGRVREGGDWSARLEAAPAVDAAFTVESLCLVKSTLSPRGSTYETLAEAKLGI